MDPSTRQEVLAKYDHRCQTCGRRGPERGGLATLHVHHIERDPVEMGEHDMVNLTLLCRSCHSWLHQQTTRDDAPVELTEEDLSVLLPQDIEILRVLARDGPARTGDIAAKLTADLTVSSVRERLWVLMGLDNVVETRDRQIVDKDVETGEWGLTDQIETSSRGYIPDDSQLLLQRMEDEQVRQALDRGCDRHMITEVLGVSRRTTFNKEKRAKAYDFPLEAFYNRGGRPTGIDRETDESSDGDTSRSRSDDKQQRLDRIADSDASSNGRTETWGSVELDVESSVEEDIDAASDAVQRQDIDAVKRALREALDALEAGESTL
ncbi:HNH endonuclease [Halopenitus sp. H-Gu1]|uniref:HNH endonuclease n=1 Tax=Halopenitus sp. H-Gu1 TaxID=3242697 RepID=UPI00359E2B83